MAVLQFTVLQGVLQSVLQCSVLQWYNIMQWYSVLQWYNVVQWYSVLQWDSVLQFSAMLVDCSAAAYLLERPVPGDRSLSSLNRIKPLTAALAVCIGLQVYRCTGCVYRNTGVQVYWLCLQVYRSVQVGTGVQVYWLCVQKYTVCTCVQVDRCTGE